MAKSASQYTILIAEDDTDLSLLIRRHLQRQGYKTASAASGAEAIDFAAKLPQEILMLLDYQLGDMSAADVIRRLKKEHLDIPFIVITGQGSETVAIEMMRLGARDYLAKNTSFLELLPEVVKHVLDQLDTEKKLAIVKDALRMEKTHLLNNIPDMVFQIDYDDRFTSLNPAVSRILGYSIGEMISKNIYDFIHPDDTRNVKRDYEIVKRGQQLLKHPIHFMHKDGSCRWVQGNPVAIYNDEHQPTGISAIYQDVTEQKLASETIKKAKERIRTLERQRYNLNNTVGQCPQMQRVFNVVSRVAPATCSILISGESGTGKDIIAEMIHRLSDRKNEKFVPINCGSIPEGLLESELFGHTKGSYTGADSTKEGLVQSANGGTLFLDEIGDMPLTLQVKLLRLIQNRQIQKVGSTNQEDIDVRIIAASNQPLAEKVVLKTFRRDLYYRINVIEIKLPPLRERGGDISLLMAYFLERYSKALGKKVATVAPEVAAAFERYPWPGNVRELQNAIERAVTFCQEETVTIDDIPSTITDYLADSSSMTGSIQQRLRRYELDCIKRTLESHNHDLNRSANELGISLATLYRKLKKFELPIGRRIISLQDYRRSKSSNSRAADAAAQL